MARGGGLTRSLAKSGGDSHLWGSDGVDLFGMKSSRRRNGHGGSAGGKSSF